MCETMEMKQGSAYILIEAVGATPIRPAGLSELVVVFAGKDVHNGVNEAEHETVGHPVDDNVNGHVVCVDCYSVGGETWRIWRGGCCGVIAQ